MKRNELSAALAENTRTKAEYVLQAVTDFCAEQPKLRGSHICEGCALAPVAVEVYDECDSCRRPANYHK